MYIVVRGKSVFGTVFWQSTHVVVVFIMAPTKGVSSTSTWAGSSDAVAAFVPVEQPQAVVADDDKGVDVPVGPNIFCDPIGGQSVQLQMALLVA